MGDNNNLELKYFHLFWGFGLATIFMKYVKQKLCCFKRNSTT